MRRSVAGRRSRGLRARTVGMAAALIAGLILAGCGLGPGDETGSASLLVTRDYGKEVLIDEPDLAINESSSAMRLVDENADLETTYGGDFVQTVNGISGEKKGGRTFDWFFSVNGIVAERGSAQFPVKAGDFIWWDHRDWTDAMEVGAVVGAYPAPFSTGYDDRGWGVQVDCLGDRSTCRLVEKQLEDDGVRLEDSGENMTIRVGTWNRIQGTPEGRRITRGPATSGVFARFEAVTTGLPENADPDQRAWDLIGLSGSGEGGQAFGPEAGLVAAMRRAEDPPVWLITGGTDQAVEMAAVALDRDYLARRYAAVVSERVVTSLPLP